jgi:hypothetical protein
MATKVNFRGAIARQVPGGREGDVPAGMQLLTSSIVSTYAFLQE